MVVNSSRIGMESARKYTSVRMDAVVFRSRLNDANKQFGAGVGLSDEKDSDKALKNTLSDYRDSMNGLMNRFERFRISSPSQIKAKQDEISRVRTACLNYLMCILFGKRPEDLKFQEMDSGSDVTQEEPQMVEVTIGALEQSHYFMEEESTQFSTTGTVVTGDGREINFNLEMGMSRRFEEYYTQSHDINVQLCDPLVINLDGECADVSDQKIFFDLDGDGEKEHISALGAGSGYLALDKNGDGVINDGNELFGTKSQNGFYDLSGYDEDGNGFIDEADSIFDKLVICTMDPDGTQHLYKLKDKDVGAIYLGSNETEFSLNHQETNQVNAVIRRTGIFLYENGNVGTVQQMDLAQ